MLGLCHFHARRVLREIPQGNAEGPRARIEIDLPETIRFQRRLRAEVVGFDVVPVFRLHAPEPSVVERQRMCAAGMQGLNRPRNLPLRSDIRKDPADEPTVDTIIEHDCLRTIRRA